MYAFSMIRIHGNYATLEDIRGLLAVATDPEIRSILEACLRMRGVGSQPRRGLVAAGEA